MAHRQGVACNQSRRCARREPMRAGRGAPDPDKRRIPAATSGRSAGAGRAGYSVAPRSRECRADPGGRAGGPQPEAVASLPGLALCGARGCTCLKFGAPARAAWSHGRLPGVAPAAASRPRGSPSGPQWCSPGCPGPALGLHAAPEPRGRGAGNPPCPGAGWPGAALPPPNRPGVRMLPRPGGAEVLPPYRYGQARLCSCAPGSAGEGNSGARGTFARLAAQRCSPHLDFAALKHRFGNAGWGAAD